MSREFRESQGIFAGMLWETPGNAPDRFIGAQKNPGTFPNVLGEPHEPFSTNYFINNVLSSFYIFYKTPILSLVHDSELFPFQLFYSKHRIVPV